MIQKYRLCDLSKIAGEAGSQRGVWRADLPERITGADGFAVGAFIAPHPPGGIGVWFTE